MNKQAIALMRHYPHTGPLSLALFAVKKYGYQKCLTIAGECKSSLEFRKKVCDADNA